MIHYRRTQVSWPAVVPMAATAVVLGGVFVASGFLLPLGFAVAVVALILSLFATLTVIVDDTGIEARFGIGLVRKRVPFDRIRACRVVRNPWYYGWGLHFIPGGMLYNASGLSAIELQLKSGRVVRIGSGEPEALAAAVRPHAPATADDIVPDSMPIAGLGVVVGIVAAVVGLAAWMIYLGLQPPAVQVTADSFSVRNGPYSNTVALRHVKAATLEDHIPRVRGKTNGFAAGETLRGSFRVDTWGSARLYVNLNHPPFVVVRSDDGFVAVNFANPQQTRDMYAELRQALDSEPMMIAFAITAYLLTALAANATATIEQVAWMQGCWQMDAGPRVVEEQWMAPRGGVMLGMGRTVRDGKLVEYESVVMREQDGRIAYEAHPSGQPSAVFTSQAIGESTVVFENPMHDFPQRVGYTRDGDSLLAWIEGTANGKSRRVDFPYRRVACAGSLKSPR